MPCIFLSAGTTKRLQVTTADTGFPGSAKIIFLTPSISKVANVVGKLETKKSVLVCNCWVTEEVTREL